MIHKILTTDKHGKLFLEYCANEWSSGDYQPKEGDRITFIDQGQNYIIYGNLLVENIIGGNKVEKPTLICSVD